MLAPLAKISCHSATSHSFFTVSHCKIKEGKRKRNVWDEKHESLGHFNCFLNMSLCCQYWKVVVSSINEELFSHYKVKIITTFFPIFYKSQTERKNSRGKIWSNLCEKIVPMNSLSPVILPLEQFPTLLTSSVKRLWVKFIIFWQTLNFHWK